MRKYVDLPSEHVSESVAADLSKCLYSPCVITFRGEIGAGKTTFIRALLRALGITGAIKSPTFSLVESYETDHFAVHHFDLYRIHDVSELDYLGFRDYFLDNTVCLIEWPERAEQVLEFVDIECRLTIKGMGRLMQLHSFSDQGSTLLRSVDV